MTSHAAPQDAELLAKLRAKGIDKFAAYEIPLDLARRRCGRHFDMIMRDVSRTDSLGAHDFDGERAFRLFEFSELGEPIIGEP